MMRALCWAVRQIISFFPHTRSSTSFHHSCSYSSRRKSEGGRKGWTRSVGVEEEEWRKEHAGRKEILHVFCQINHLLHVGASRLRCDIIAINQAMVGFFGEEHWWNKYTTLKSDYLIITTQYWVTPLKITGKVHTLVDHFNRNTCTRMHLSN